MPAPMNSGSSPGSSGEVQPLTEEKRGCAMRIQGSVALVTGANRGLGKALVAALLEAGAAKVYAAARDEKKLPAASSRVVPIVLDTTRPEQIAAVAERANDV